KGWPNHFTERCLIPLRAANRNLIPLFAILIDTKNTDVPYMVMTTGVHSTGNIQIDWTKIKKVIQIIETLLNRLRNRNGFSICQWTKLSAGKGNDIGKQPNVGRSNP